MEKKELETLLARLRDACLFLLKGDVLALGALVTLISVFKLEPPQILGVASSYLWVLQSIGGLIVFGLLYEAFLTVAEGGADKKQNQKIANAARITYGLFATFQCMVLFYVLGYLGGYLG
jgi:hypothetical protein